MTGLEAIWIPMVAGAVVGGGTAAAKGGSFGDIAKGTGLGAAGGAVTGGLASGLGALGGGMAGGGTNQIVDEVTKKASNVPSGLELPLTSQNTPSVLTPFDQAKLNNMGLMAKDVLSTNADFSNAGALGPAQPAQPQPTTATDKNKWTTADYINATSSAANLAANIAQSPETPRTPIAPMPAIFSGQGGDLMQQLSQLSQG